MADLKVLEAVNSSSTGAPGSGCSRLRVVRFLGSPNGRRLRRVLVVLVVIVGSDRGRRMPRLISPLHLRSDSRQSHVPHTHTPLSTQLPSDQMFFSLLFHISRQDVFFFFTHRIF